MALPAAAVLKVPVRFELGVHCQFGQTLGLVGDTRELGEWDTSKALKLKVSNRDGGGGGEGWG